MLRFVRFAGQELHGFRSLLEFTLFARKTSSSCTCSNSFDLSQLPILLANWQTACTFTGASHNEMTSQSLMKTKLCCSHPELSP